MAEKSSHPWKEPGNKYAHGIRCAKLVLRLRDMIFPDTDDPRLDPDILTVAAWFHDICNGQHDHEKAGAELVHTLLCDYLTEEELDTVCAIIRVHDHKETDRSDYSPAILLLQDADVLDHLGTYSIWITISEFAYKHKTPEEYAVQFDNGVFAGFAARWRKWINYPQSLVLFDEKIQYETEFAHRMRRELMGEFQ